ncbi:MAG: STAS domain-containing protein [Acidimicrobiales bacterium]|nr:STAS domain-containing protein [Acidimicrobiales bacterium]
MDLQLDVSEHGEWSVLRVGGEIDVATAPGLRQRLVALVGEGRYRIVVDMSQVDFIDSTGLGVLIGTLKRVRSHGGELHLVCDVDRVVRVFEITGLDTIFTMHRSLDAIGAG